MQIAVPEIMVNRLVKFMEPAAAIMASVTAEGMQKGKMDRNNNGILASKLV